MPRRALLLLVILGTAACNRNDAPAPAASASAPPPAASPKAAVEVPPSATASASAKPAPSPERLPGFPGVDPDCTKDADCGASFFDESCCSDCTAHVGNKKWVKTVAAFCSSVDAGARSAPCAPNTCSPSLFGRPVCSAGKCVPDGPGAQRGAAAPPARFPPVDGKCQKDDDCDAVFVDDRCCAQCPARLGNKKWVSAVKDYCATKRCETGPMGCSWGYSKRCLDGVCQSK